MISLGLFKWLYPKNPLLALLMEYQFYLLIITFIYLIYKKIKNLNAIRTIIIWKEGYQEIKDILNKDGQLQIRVSNKIKKYLKKDYNEWTPICTHEHIIPPRRKVRNIIKPFGFKQKPLAIAVEDSNECVKIYGEKEERDISISERVSSTILKTWTKEEMESWIRKNMAIASVQRKVFSDNQFYIFMFIMLFIAFLVLRIALTVKAI